MSDQACNCGCGGGTVVLTQKEDPCTCGCECCGDASGDQNPQTPDTTH